MMKLNFWILSPVWVGGKIVDKLNPFDPEHRNYPVPIIDWVDKKNNGYFNNFPDGKGPDMYGKRIKDKARKWKLDNVHPYKG